MIYDLIIVGAGAAGLFMATHLSSKYQTLILEKNHKPGLKLGITGAGQCNLTHADPIKLWPNKYNHPKQVRKILYQYNNQMLIEDLVMLNIPTMIREDGKVFPTSLDAKDVIKKFIEAIHTRGHQVLYNQEVDQIQWIDALGAFVIKTKTDAFTSRKLVIATGGKSYPQTGSDGKMLEILSLMGVKVIPFKPALTTVRIKDYTYGHLAGIVCQDIQMTIISPGTGPLKKKGDLLFIPTELTGPLILNHSRNMVPDTQLVFDYLPQWSIEKVVETMKQYCNQLPKKEWQSILELAIPIPKRLMDAIAHKHNMAVKKKGAEISKEEIKGMALGLKADSCYIQEVRGFDKGMISAGGVSIEDVDLETFSWKQNPHLHFIGEILDFDGETGGYNLQLAFSIAKKLTNNLLFD